MASKKVKKHWTKMSDEEIRLAREWYVKDRGGRSLDKFETHTRGSGGLPRGRKLVWPLLASAPEPYVLPGHLGVWVWWGVEGGGEQKRAW